MLKFRGPNSMPLRLCNPQEISLDSEPGSKNMEITLLHKPSKLEDWVITSEFHSYCRPSRYDVIIPIRYCTEVKESSAVVLESSKQGIINLDMPVRSPNISYYLMSKDNSGLIWLHQLSSFILLHSSSITALQIHGTTFYFHFRDMHVLFCLEWPFPFTLIT